MVLGRYEIYRVNLEPTIRSEIRKTRTCVIISPNEMNQNISTIIIAPLTSTQRNYPTRINCQVQGREGQIVLDQIRTVDKIRLIKKIDILTKKTQQKIHKVLFEMFAE